MISSEMTTPSQQKAPPSGGGSGTSSHPEAVSKKAINIANRVRDKLTGKQWFNYKQYFLYFYTITLLWRC